MSSTYKWRWTTSTRVSSAVYDADKRELQLTFVDGTDWVYEGVPFKEWNHFKVAPSAGRFVDMVLNKYDNHAA